GRSRGAVRGHCHPRAAPAAFRSHLPDRTQAMNELPWLHPPRVGALEAALSDRILVLDGAMGTMIQRHGLDESGYRGERFADAALDQRGNNDLLSLARPGLI